MYIYVGDMYVYVNVNLYVRVYVLLCVPNYFVCYDQSIEILLSIVIIHNIFSY